MPASDRGIEDVQPEMNQRSSAMTARMKTRFVVRRGRMGIAGEEGSSGEEGREREKRRGEGANRERVPVPVLGDIGF